MSTWPRGREARSRGCAAITLFRVAGRHLPRIASPSGSGTRSVLKRLRIWQIPQEKSTTRFASHAAFSGAVFERLWVAALAMRSGESSVSLFGLSRDGSEEAHLHGDDYREQYALEPWQRMQRKLLSKRGIALCLLVVGFAALVVQAIRRGHWWLNPVWLFVQLAQYTGLDYGWAGKLSEPFIQHGKQHHAYCVSHIPALPPMPCTRLHSPRASP